MNEEQTRSDLKDRVQHEHQHLRSLFEDLQVTFEKIAAGSLEAEPLDEALESASEDLAVALDEMLHHFNQEEEIFFVDIENRFPELSDDIARLVAGHETMCERTRWLHKQLKRGPAEIAAEVGSILDVVVQMREAIIAHTTEEQAMFDEVLDKIPQHERVALLREMQSI